MSPESTSHTDLSAPATSTGVAPRRRSPVRVLLSAGLILLLVAASIPGYGWWKQRRTDQFKAGCVAATKEEQWERLGLIAMKWREWDPSSNDANVYLAESEFQAGRLDEAARLLGMITDDYHGAISALSFRGEILYGDLHRPYEAEETWQRMLTIDPRNTHAHQRLILFYALSLQRHKMVEQIQEALRRRCEPPESYAYLILANALGFTEGISHVRNWRTNHPDDETLEVAEALYKANQPVNPSVVEAYEESHFMTGDQSAINACLDKYPQNVEVLAFHIERHIYFGRADEVVGLLNSAPAAALDDARFWRYRGWLLEQTQEHAKAVEALEKSLAIDPFGWRSRWELASLLRLLGRTADAEQVQVLALEGKVLQEELYRTDGRALTWGQVEQIRSYISKVGEPQVLAALDARIRSQGGENVAAELMGGGELAGESD